MNEFTPTRLTEWFVKNVRELKAKQRIKSDTDLSKDLDYSQANLSRVLNGKRDIPAEYAIEFARQFQLPSPFTRFEIGLEEWDDADGKVEAVAIRPYNRPVILTIDQQSYLENYDLPAYIAIRNRRILPEGAKLRGSEWRWFEAGGNLAEPTFEETDLLLGRFIVEDDWGIQPIAELYIITTQNRLFLGRLMEVKEGQFTFDITSIKQKKPILWKNVKELWRVKSSVLRGEL